MSGVLPSHILVHVATPVSYVEGIAGDEMIEGEPGEAGAEPIEGTPFEAVLFLPGPGGEESNPYKPRTIRRPTLLYNPDRGLVDASRGLVGDGSAIVLGAEDELLIDAVELASFTGGERVRWQVDGEPQPFGPPGRVIGVQATLKRVEQ
jgi:hypothetical protein